jgi:hypothetical protein
MAGNVEYTSRERFWLWCVATFGFLAVNGAFAFGLLFRPGAIMSALTNPLSGAFIVEAMLMMGLLAYLLTRWGVGRLHWVWFVVLSFLGSMAFALPVVVLWPRRGS